jgi:uncharacterized protein
MSPSKTAVPVGAAPAWACVDVHAPPPVVAIPRDAGALLLRLARVAIEDAVAARWARLASFDDLLHAPPPAAVLAPAAAFVTLHEDGDLRGCVGSFAIDRPLWETVVGAAVSAALDDPRFPPVTEDEVPRLSIDVSVLGPAVPLGGKGDFVPGRDGVIVARGGRRGLLLPEVAADQGWGATEMLEGTCWKAGLTSGAWRDPRTEVLVFRTARFSDADRD